MTILISIPACEEHLREKMKPDDQLIILRPYEPIYTQIAHIPDDVPVIACPPSTWSKEENDDFAYRISESVLSLMVSRNTIGHFLHTWQRNAIQNYERFLTAKTVDDIPQSDIVTIYGNGPSLDPDLQEGTILATWHSVNRIKKAHYIGHIDGAAPREGMDLIAMAPFQPECGIIGTPTTCDTFFKAYPETPLFSYFTTSPLDMFMAEKLRHPGHHAVSNTVVDLLMHVARFLNPKEIHLTGFDLSSPTKEEAIAYDPIPDHYPVIGVNGKTVWTNMPWQKQQTATEGFIKRYPHIKYVNHSTGLHIDGTVLA